MRRQPLRSCFLALLLAAAAPAASHASVIYAYHGDHFTGVQDADPPAGVYTTSMGVSGYVELASALPPFFSGSLTPLSYSFTDGRNSFSSAAPPGTVVFQDFVTGASGQIESWNVWLREEPSPGDVRQLMSSQWHDEGVVQVDVDGEARSDAGWNNSLPGSWAIAATSVPALTVPVALGVSPPYPNPSAGAIVFDVRSDAPSVLVIDVFDAAGRRVAGREISSAGARIERVTLDGRDVEGSPLPTGVYVARVRATGAGVAAGECTRKFAIVR